MGARSVLVGKCVARAAYGLGSLLAPDALARAAGQPAPDADPRYFNALFGGRDLTVVAAVLAALARGDERQALWIDGSCELTDLVALVQEVRRRGGLDGTTKAALGFAAFGQITWLLAARRLD